MFYYIPEYHNLSCLLTFSCQEFDDIYFCFPRNIFLELEIHQIFEDTPVKHNR